MDPRCTSSCTAERHTERTAVPGGAKPERAGRGGLRRHAAGSEAACADGLAVRCLPSKSTEQTRPGTPHSPVSSRKASSGTAHEQPGSACSGSSSACSSATCCSSSGWWRAAPARVLLTSAQWSCSSCSPPEKMRRQTRSDCSLRAASAGGCVAISRRNSLSSGSSSASIAPPSVPSAPPAMPPAPSAAPPAAMTAVAVSEASAARRATSAAFSTAAGSTTKASSATSGESSRYVRLQGSAHAASSARIAAVCVVRGGSDAGSSVAASGGGAVASGSSAESPPPVRTLCRSRSLPASSSRQTSHAATSAPPQCGCFESWCSSSSSRAVRLPTDPCEP
mmetsp:Transcript_36908/g.93582  ORF Transcript_36908/g.93582 Transcript_36908/m.93582 type:complete len:337 (-) Transcript_36908:607-1617(-)